MDKQYLYDLAFQFKKDKLWKKLYDTEIYAVRLDDGQIGYCCVMGQLGEVLALTLYVGERGFNSFWNLIGDDIEIESEADVMTQDCIQCGLESRDALGEQELKEVRAYAKEKGIVLRGANAFPQFQRYRPFRVPWMLTDEAEWGYIARALEITNRLSVYLKDHRKTELGLRSIMEFDGTLPLLTEDGDGLRAEPIPMPQKIAPVYPEPAALDDMTLARLRKLKRLGVWECDIVRMPEPVQNDPEQVPYLPAQLMVVDQESEQVVGTALSGDAEVDPDDFQNALADMLTRSNVCPMNILVRNKQTRQVVQGLCAGLNIQLETVEDLPELEDALESLYEHFTGGEVAPSEISDQMDEMIEALSEMSDEELRHLPPFIRQQLLALDEWGMIPEDLAKRLR